MAHSNKTDFLNLPQFEGSDHPTFQGDFNGAFLSLDSFASDTNTDLLELFSSKNTLEALTNSLNESVNDLTAVSSTMAGSIQDLATKYQTVNGALNSLSNTVESYDVQISDATTTANNALSEAQSAFSNASSQGNRLTSLEGTVSTLSTNVSSATTTANTAKSTAETAKTTATTAKNTADTAKTTADSAQTQANTNKTNIANLQTTVNGLISATLAKFKEYALNAIFPVGSIYLSVVNTSPSTFLGGTWSKISSGRYFYTATSAGNTTGGSSTASFKLTERQTPWKQCGEEAKGFGLTNSNVQNQGAAYGFGDRVAVARNDTANQDSVSINLTPSYYTVIAWRRTA